MKSKGTDNAKLTETYIANQGAVTEAIANLDTQVDHLLSARGDLAAGAQPTESELVSFTGTATVNDGEWVNKTIEQAKAVIAKLKAVAPKAERASSGERPVAFKLVNKADGSDVYAEDSGLGWFTNKGQKTLRSPKYAGLDLSKVQMIDIATGEVIRDGSEFTVMDAPGTATAAA